MTRSRQFVYILGKDEIMGKRVTADRRDYKNGYQKQYKTYQLLKQNNDSRLCRCLLLNYSVECGLKFLLLDKFRIVNPQKTSMDEEIEGVLYSHDLRKLLKKLGQTKFKFPIFETRHGDQIDAENFHQLCRYAVEVDDKNYPKSQQFELELSKIADWLEEEI